MVNNLFPKLSQGLPPKYWLVSQTFLGLFTSPLT